MRDERHPAIPDLECDDRDGHLSHPEESFSPTPQGKIASAIITLLAIFVVGGLISGCATANASFDLNARPTQNAVYRVVWKAGDVERITDLKGSTVWYNDGRCPGISRDVERTIKKQMRRPTSSPFWLFIAGDPSDVEYELLMSEAENDRLRASLAALYRRHVACQP